MTIKKTLEALGLPAALVVGAEGSIRVPICTLDVPAQSLKTGEVRQCRIVQQADAAGEHC